MRERKPTVSSHELSFPKRSRFSRAKPDFATILLKGFREAHIVLSADDEWVLFRTLILILFIAVV